MNASPAVTKPGLLLVEDDPVSAAFLTEGAALLELDVRWAADAASARLASLERHFDLLLIDAHLPDGLGEDLLRALRKTGQDAPALAHTAAADADLHRRLFASGFCEVLRKPLPVVELHAALRRYLRAGCGPIWDDAAALAALGGRPEQVAALRALFLDELPLHRQQIAAAVGRRDEAAVRAELHRLSASCGFVGAARLAEAVRRMRTTPMDVAALRALEAAAEELLRSPD